MDGESPTEDAVRTELARILDSPLFKRSARLTAFLRHIVEQTLAGRTDSLKEQVLALELYGRGSEFDGGLDPIVRVDARRLRDKLREYYVERPTEPLIIALPKGTYVPVFEHGAGQPHPLLQSSRSDGHSRSKLRLALLAMLLVAIAGASALLYRTSHERTTTLRPLVSLAGTNGPPSLSPDGRMAVFYWSGPPEQPSPGLYIKPLEGENVQRLTIADATANPAWSPLGFDIAFSRSGPHGGIFVMSHLGGPERKLADSGANVTWTPDGTAVLFQDRETSSDDAQAPVTAIYSVSLETFERRHLTHPSMPTGDVRAAISPDGSTMAFIRSGIPGLSDIYVSSTSGGEPRRLTDWNGVIEGLAWTADSKEIIYGAYEPVGPRLWRVSARASSPGRGVRLAESTGDAVSPAISGPDASGRVRLAYLTRRVDSSLRLVDLSAPDASGALSATRMFQHSSRWDYGGRFSPDGRRVAFISTRTGTAEIWVCGRDGSELRRVTDIQGDPVFVSWSPDSRRVAFLSAPGPAGNKRIYVVGVDGGVPTPITGETEIVLNGSWSRDGRWIYFMSDRSGGFQIWKMNPSGGNAVQITRLGGFESQESPDGQYLFYTAKPPDEPSGRQNPVPLKRVPVDGGEEITVLERVWTFHWTVTDAGLYFFAPEPGPKSINRYRFDTGAIEQIGHLPDQHAVLDGDMSISRDGRALFMSQVEDDDTSLTIVDGFR